MPGKKSKSKKKDLVAGVSKTKRKTKNQFSVTDQADLDKVGDHTSVTTASSISEPSPVSAAIQKVLAQEIKSSGGIEQVITSPDRQYLSKLLDKNKPIFGQRGDKLRQQLGRKVNTWKKLYHQGAYANKVIDKFGVVPWGVQNFEKRKKLNQGERKVEGSVGSDSELSDSGSDDDSNTEAIIPRNIGLDLEKEQASTGNNLNMTVTPSGRRMPPANTRKYI